MSVVFIIQGTRIEVPVPHNLPDSYPPLEQTTPRPIIQGDPSAYYPQSEYLPAREQNMFQLLDEGQQSHNPMLPTLVELIIEISPDGKSEDSSDTYPNVEGHLFPSIRPGVMNAPNLPQVLAYAFEVLIKFGLSLSGYASNYQDLALASSNARTVKPAEPDK